MIFTILGSKIEWKYQKIHKFLSVLYFLLAASELRSWLFHYSLPCLRGILPEKYLNHYLLLVNAIWLLNQESITKEDLACSNFCLLKFVLYFDGLYGKLNL